jgi:hypothetical protein
MKRPGILMICLGVLFGIQTVLGQREGTVGVDPRNPVPEWYGKVAGKRERDKPINGIGENGMMIKRETYPRGVPLYRGEKAETKELIDAFYRTRGMILVPDSYLEKFKLQLKDKKVGLARLQPERNCYKDLLVTVEQLEKCSDVVPVPGGGSFYSFRSRLNYDAQSALAYVEGNTKLSKTLPTLNPRAVGTWWNIHFEDGKFKVTNDFVQGIVAEIGDVELENLSLTSKEFEFLNDFKFRNDTSIIQIQNESLMKGVALNNFTYSNSAKANLNSTYVLRSIDYTEKPKWMSTQFPEPFFSKVGKEADMIIAFKVVGQEDDGSLIILWKKLQGRQIKSK